MSLACDNQDVEQDVMATNQDEDKEIFSKTISQLIEDKFSFSTSQVALERKPKADKGV